MRAVTVLVIALAVSGGLQAAPPRPGLTADLSDAVLAKLRRLPASATPAATLQAVLAAGEAYTFVGDGLRIVADTRWFQVSSVEGPGAPLLEVRRWPGDTVLAFYDLPPDGIHGDTLPAGTTLGARREGVSGWTCRDAGAAAPRGDFDAVWCERVAGGSRRLGALGVPGDAGLGESAIPDLREAIFEVMRSTSVSDPAPNVHGALLLPELADPPRAADETKHGWGAFQGEDFTIGLPPGVRAIRLDFGVPPPRPMPYASAWLRGRFTDRDGKAVIVGDTRHAGYVAKIVEPSELWRAGVAPPLGAPSAERLDEARLEEAVLESTKASRAIVSHWKDSSFSGDWVVFRLHFAGKGIEIGLPAVAGWRSLALFWIPVTYRGEGLAPAPPPIDPAVSLGVRFKQLKPGEAKRNGLIEGTLFIADLKLEIPRGWWPVANLSSRDGLPVAFVAEDGTTVGRLEGLAAGTGAQSPRAEDGWVAMEKPQSQHAAAIWTRADGATLLFAKDGHGFALLPEADVPAQREGWRLLRERAEFVKAARRR